MSDLTWNGPDISGNRTTYESTDWRFQVVDTRGAIHVRDSLQDDNGGWVPLDFTSVAEAQAHCNRLWQEQVAAGVAAYTDGDDAAGYNAIAKQITGES